MINPDFTTHNKDSTFFPFPRLPVEIRLEIWRQSLQRQRLIHVYLEKRTEQAATQTAASTDSVSKREKFEAIVDGYQALSKLLRINSESRWVALGFYRVRIPCWFRERGLSQEVKSKPGLLLFNPEHDFLHISSRPLVEDTLIDFLYHLKTTYDPRRTGLLKLMVEYNDLVPFQLYDPESSHLSPEAESAFRETLTQLREVFFGSSTRAGRQITGPLSGLSYSKDTIFNRSLPIMAASPAFDRLHHDPRPIAPDLRRIWIKTFHPQSALRQWRELLEKLRISPTQTQHRLYLAFAPTRDDDQIHGRDSAARWLQKEDDVWTGADQTKTRSGKDQKESSFARFLDEKKYKMPIGAQSEEYKDEDLEKAVKPAFGFWLFPVNAVDAPLGDNNWSMDLSNHLPELALSSLP